MRDAREVLVNRHLQRRDGLLRPAQIAREYRVSDGDGDPLLLPVLLQLTGLLRRNRAVGAGKPEQLLSAADTLTWLSGWLRSLDQLPADLADQPDVESAAQRLIDTACDLEISPGVTLQWFAVRLEPPTA